jgi:hypothetical protein
VYFKGSDVNTHLGDSFATGDLDADGTADLVANGSYESAAVVYVAFGPLSSDRSAEDADVAVRDDTGDYVYPRLASGDADGDGNDDLLVTAYTTDYDYVFFGPVTADASLSDFDLRLQADQLQYQERIATVGDHDGDGFFDIAAADWSWIYGYVGHVHVTTGDASGTVDLRRDSTYTYTGTGTNDLGWTMASVDDTTGDGIADLALGDPLYDEPKDLPHGVYILPGGEDSGSYSVGDAAVGTLQSTEADLFGQALGASDRDGDGYTDLLVGARETVYEFRGPLTDLRDSADADAWWEGEESEFGASIAADGDVDGDGQPDALLGAPAQHGASAVYVQLGPASGSLDTTDLPKFETSAAFAGSTLAFVPDWTGDGAPEMAISNSWGSSTGRVGVFFSEAF